MPSERVQRGVDSLLDEANDIEFGAYGPPGLLPMASLRCWIDANLESGTRLIAQW